jgi:transposase
MTKIEILFTPEEMEALHYERYHHPDPKVQRRMEALYLKGQGVSHGDICRVCRISRTTLDTWLRLYLEGGMEALKEFHYSGQPSALNDHASSLEVYFREHPPHNATEAKAVIERRTGIKRSPTPVRAFMKRLGLKYRKMGRVPGTAHEEEKQKEQETFEQAA